MVVVCVCVCDLDCSEVSEAEIDHLLACQTLMRLEMEDESDSSAY